MVRTVKLHAYQALYLMLAVLTLQGCGTMGYGDVDIDTTRKGIVAATAEIRGANLLLQDLIQRQAISRAQAQSAQDALQQAKDGLQVALNAIELGGDPAAADTRLQAVNASLSVALQILGPLVEN